jgi:hypothetical protein
MKKIALFIVLIFTCLHSWALNPNALDYSNLQNQFEQKVITRLQLVLNPLLGADNYTIDVNTSVKKLDSNAAEFRFTKLGLTATLPMALIGDGYRFENWIDGLSVDIDYSDELTDVDPKIVQSRVENSLKSLGKFKSTVKVSAFTPVKSQKVKLRNVPWTPLAILIFSIASFFALQMLSKVIGKLKADSHSGAVDFTGAGVNESTGTSASGKAVEDIHFAKYFANQDGLKRFTQWVQDDDDTAKQFIEKLARSQIEGDNALIAYILQISEIKTTRQLLTGLKPESVSRIKEISSADLNPSRFAELDHMLSMAITQHYIDQHLDGDHILKIIHDFTIEECLYTCEENPLALGLYMRYYSTPHVEQILAKISNEKLNEFFEAEQSKKINWVDIGKKARAAVMKMREQQDVKSDDQVGKWLTLASHLSPDRELSFYKKIIENHSFSDIRELALENYPQFLIEKLPDQIVKPVLNSYPITDRANLLYAFDKEKRSSMLKFYKNEIRVQEVIDVELELIQSDANRAKNINNKKSQYQKDFYSRIRRYIKTSPENIAVAEEILDKWSKSNKGASHGRKKAVA